MTGPALRATAVSKRFGAVNALKDVDFVLEPGEVHALLGVNGAGKSTFIKIISGVYTRDAGTLEVDGKAVDCRTPHDAMMAGIATVQQHPELVSDFTGYENIFLGREADRPRFLARIDRTALKRRGDALLARFPVDIDLSRKLSEMPAVEREIVAILQALAGDHIRVLILDEPTSTLTEVEKAVLFRLMRTLKASGISILYITHRLEEVIEIADRFSVFRGGRKVATMTPAAAAEQGLSLAELMLGETLSSVFPEKAAFPPGETVLSVERLGHGRAFSQVGFEVKRGEILGIFGLVGSGIDELSKVLFGALPPTEGTLSLKGRPLRARTPREALKAGIFLVPGDRRLEGLALTQSSVFNITIGNLGRASGFAGILRRALNRRKSEEFAARVALSPPNLSMPVSGFSGGNQQKIVVAKGLFADADLYIFVEPTVGVDIGARAKLYGLMRDLSRTAAVIVMSSDCDEVHGLADRSFALYKGRPIMRAGEIMTRNQLLLAGILGEARDA
ncbi:ribose transport system ATP-binding protein/rhamnose transport system ATP-binding protein [Rhizobium sp. RU20A]|uniref:sugar ABC transporter ATP-binding protein n=1 Tax=Rhizobium sp. RU20A TaxID=1907412 RepID=UPI0009552BB9|nr:sugar ABC transporter ATP-binding protein [Rhizobium sp. RU20A]SIQ96051.1 ribose transport system ATP-binding protein/rhamnose transport system ATP-binding protein [Rhizobium sp. RU20A]